MLFCMFLGSQVALSLPCLIPRGFQINNIFFDSMLSVLCRYGLETKNRLVDRLREEVDLFMMTPECTLALDALDALKEQLDFHYQRINQHVASFADARLKALPLGGPATQPLCIRYVYVPFFLYLKVIRGEHSSPSIVASLFEFV